MSDDGMLVFEAATVRYGAVTAIENLSLAVERGEMFGLIGPDGAGKTTTLRLALGLLAPSAGRVSTCGLDPSTQRRKLSGRVGYLSQRFSLYGDLSVDENLAFFAAIHAVPDFRSQREELLDLVRLTPFRRRLADRLSGGMRQKLALAATLIHRPELLVLDEPTTGVDPVSRRDFWRLLTRLRREGLTVVLTTPYLDEAERCRRVALLDHGRLIALDAPRELRRALPGRVLEVIAHPRDRAVARLRAYPGVDTVETFGERFHVRLLDDGGPGVEERLAEELRRAGIEVRSARAVEPSLEDVFIARVRAAGGPEVTS